MYLRVIDKMLLLRCRTQAGAFRAVGVRAAAGGHLGAVSFGRYDTEHVERLLWCKL